MVLVVFDASIHETKEAAARAKEILRKEAIVGRIMKIHNVAFR